jgi:hypothetical protein
MKTCLVCLVSDQTIPNILVAAQLYPDFLLFISTADMEKKCKSKAILDTLKVRGQDYSGAYHTLEVAEDSIIDCQNKISQWLAQSEEEYQFFVNLTGGTKLMSIAAFDLFTDFGSQMIYVPISKNQYLTPFPKRRHLAPTALGARLSVAEYLTAYGFSITNRKNLENQKQQATARESTTRHLYANYTAIRPLLNALRSVLPAKKTKALKRGHELKFNPPPSNAATDEFIAMMAFEPKGSTISKVIHESEWNYLRGGWLEERVFLAMREVLSPEISVELGISYTDMQGNQNELDVLCACDNVLYLVECKSLGAIEGSEEIMGGTINDFLYKLGVLRQQFGLTPRAFLATTAEEVFDSKGKLEPRILERGRQLRIQVIPLVNTPDLEGYFRSVFGKTC